MASKLDAFFKSYADSEEQLDYRLAHETIGEKVPVISTGSLLLDNALSSGGLPKGRLIQYYGPSGCHAKGQQILMSNGTIKKIEEIIVGDLLMGDDSLPRKVLKLIRGSGKMYKVIPQKGDSFIVNEDHILTLNRNNESMDNWTAASKYEKIDVSLKDWLNWKKYKKAAHKLIRSQVNSFWNDYNCDSPVVNELLINPYILGILIGDGSLLRTIELTMADSEILQEFREFTLNSKLQLVAGNISGKSQTYRASGERFKANDIFSIIKDLGLNVKSGEKFIPQIYKTASFENRLEILAGLIDIDGSVSSNCVDYISKSKKLAEDVAFVARSVGLAAYISECQKSAYVGHVGTYYRVSISGDISIIPTKIPRKQCSKRKQIKNVMHTGFTVEYVGEDNFYGFILSGNGRYLLDDFTITHNSGKTLMAMIAIYEAQQENPDSQQMFIDAEQTFDPSWASVIGVDTSRVILVEGDLAVNGRKCFEMLLGVPKEDAKHILKGKSKEGFLDKIVDGTFNVNLIVLDSLGSIIPPGEDTSAIGKMNMSLLARFLTTTFRKLSLEVNKAKVPFIIINHKKDNMDPYGADHTFSGGNTYAHFLSANIYFEAVQRKDAMIVDDKENKIGHITRATIEKSKFGPWPRKCEFKVNFDVGVVDKHEEIAQLALDYDVVVKSSSVTHEYDGKKWVGFGKYCDAIKDDPVLAKDLTMKIGAAREARLDQKRKEQLLKKVSEVVANAKTIIEEDKKKAPKASKGE